MTVAVEKAPPLGSGERSTVALGSNCPIPLVEKVTLPVGAVAVPSAVASRTVTVTVTPWFT